MIEIKKYVKKEALSEEVVKIVLETALRTLEDSRNIKRICSEAIEDSEDATLDHAEVIKLIDFFRRKLYDADFSLSKVQEVMEKNFSSSTSEEKEDESKDS